MTPLLHPRRLVATLALVTALAGCTTFDSSTAPDDATLRFIFPRGDSVLVGDSLPVTALLQLEVGDVAGPRWRVHLIVDRGRLGADSTGTVALQGETDDNGLVSTMFRAPGDTGWVHITGVAGSARATDSIHVTQATPPATQAAYRSIGPT